MNDKPKPKPYFWPVVFLTAFLAAAALWCVWMYALVKKTHRQRENGVFVPQGNPPATNPAANPPPSPTNAPPRTNSALPSTNGMVWLQGGTFWMGSDDGRPDKAPADTGLSRSGFRCLWSGR